MRSPCLLIATQSVQVFAQRRNLHLFSLGFRPNTLFSVILEGNWRSNIKNCFPHILVWAKHKSEANKSLSPRNWSELGELEDLLVRLISTLKSSTSTAARNLLAAPASSRPDLLHGCGKQHAVCSLQVKFLEIKHKLRWKTLSVRRSSEAPLCCWSGGCSKQTIIDASQLLFAPRVNEQMYCHL